MVCLWRALFPERFLGGFLNRIRLYAARIMFLGKSCANTKDSIQYEDGNEYPLVKLDISQSSHPFYTGQNKVIDTSGRVDKFRKRYQK